MKNFTKNDEITMPFNEMHLMNNQTMLSIPFAKTPQKRRPGHHNVFEDVSVLIFNADTQNGNSMSLMLSTTKGFFCTGAFKNGMGLIDKIRNAQPDIVLLDVKLPDVCSVIAVKMIRADFPKIQILMLAGSEDEDMVFHAICAGASGYILKNHSLENTLEIIRGLRQGFIPMSPAVLRRVIERFHIQNTPSSCNQFGFTVREAEVMNLMIDGASYKMIAGKLGISYDTVHNHIKRIYCKLDVNSMSEAVVKVLRNQ